MQIQLPAFGCGNIYVCMTMRFFAGLKIPKNALLISICDKFIYVDKTSKVNMAHLLISNHRRDFGSKSVTNHFLIYSYEKC